MRKLKVHQTQLRYTCTFLFVSAALLVWVMPEPVALVMAEAFTALNSIVLVVLAGVWRIHAKKNREIENSYNISCICLGALGLLGFLLSSMVAEIGVCVLAAGYLLHSRLEAKFGFQHLGTEKIKGEQQSVTHRTILACHLSVFVFLAQLSP